MIILLGQFKLTIGKNGAITFLPSNAKISGHVKYAKDKETTCLSKDQARHIYKKVELEGIVNADTMKQEIEGDKLGRDNIDDDKVNCYHNTLINNIEK